MARSSAESFFNKQKRQADKAPTPVEKARLADVAKTARLRALRLAKEADDAELARVERARAALDPKPKRRRAAKPAALNS